MATDEIKIIAPPPRTAGPPSTDYLPREGETGPRPEDQFGLAFFRKKPVQKLTDEIEEIKGKIAKIVTSLSQSVADKAVLEEISVGLAVSIEGDIGIASAGAEATIELTFKVKP